MSEETSVNYLENGPGQGDRPDPKLDQMRDLLAREITWADPDPGVFERIATGIGTVDHGEAPVAQRRQFSPAWGIAAVLVIALFGVLGWIDRPQEEEAMLVAMFGTDIAQEAVGTATVRETPAGWYIRLELEGLPPAPQTSYYEGWMWRDDEGVSIGTFHLRHGAEPVALWSGVDPADYPSIWVTLQEEGAGPAASDQVVMRGMVGEPPAG